MALEKLTYTDGVTVIPASNLNDIQDAIIALESEPALVIDSALSDSSTNPVQNKVITGAIADTNSEVDELKSYLGTVETTVSYGAFYAPWVSGYIRTDGTVGSNSPTLVSGLFSGNGKAWHVQVASGFHIEQCARYSANARSSYDALALPLGTYTDFDITLESGKFYSFQIAKDSLSSISPSDISETTIQMSYTVSKINELENAVGLTESAVEITPTVEVGGFSGAVGDAIQFNTTSQWSRCSFVAEANATYILTVTTRANIIERNYVYVVDSNGIIQSEFVNVPYSPQQTLETELTFSAGDIVWVLWATGKTHKIEKKVATSAIEQLTAAVFPGKSDYDKGPYRSIKADFAGYYTGQGSDYSMFGESTLYSDVITAFDALMALDSAHITKSALGTASGTDANGNSYTIYEYDFTPQAYSGGLTLNKIPLILADGSIHGFEKNSTYGLYYFLRDLITKNADNPILTAIRNNVRLKIIPVTNPYGFDRGLYYNANSVNINRNFGTSDWQSVTGSETNNSGLAPFDQPESAIIRDWVNANKNNITAYLNIHTNGRAVYNYGDMNSCMPKFGRSNGDNYYARLANVVTRHIQRQTIMIPKADTLSVPLDAFVGKYQGETGSYGLASAWAVEQKIVGMTLELFIRLTVNSEVIIASFSDKSKKICSEMIGNIIAEIVSEYSDA